MVMYLLSSKLIQFCFGSGCSGRAAAGAAAGGLTGVGPSSAGRLACRPSVVVSSSQILPVRAIGPVLPFLVPNFVRSVHYRDSSSVSFEFSFIEFKISASSCIGRYHGNEWPKAAEFAEMLKARCSGMVGL